jgi:hypothetical protein
MNMDIRSTIGFPIRQLCDCVCIQLSRSFGIPKTRLAIALYKHSRYTRIRAHHSIVETLPSASHAVGAEDIDGAAFEPDIRQV